MIKKGVYQHFKGQRYQVLDVATHSETGEQYVVYKALYGDFGTWIRPLEMFTETIKIDGTRINRFEFLSPAA
ncbi:DUF1653 domain-containing protein [Kangiella sp. TOML190]|uniref:DUF1653 domain-containing protein n=1 Tax=Kangiella sp. TOML190 TaxID=2931351 RepID=UPI002041F2E7|nr:DUF1653 domain-containing protein [Kangiella sp. TOML190]